MDVIEDLFRLPTITHVVIVAGDSGYISLAQRAKRLDRYVVGIGVAGSTSHLLADACNEFADYDTLPGAAALPVLTVEPAKKALDATPTAEKIQSDRDKAAALLVHAMRLGKEGDNEEWLHAAAVKKQMKRMDPKFNEKALWLSSSTKFLESRPKVVEVREHGQSRMVRLRYLLRGRSRVPVTRTGSGRTRPLSLSALVSLHCNS